MNHSSLDIDSYMFLFLAVNGKMNSNMKYATVIKIIRRIWSRGWVTQERMQFIDESKWQITRNVKGSVRKRDILALLESKREARRLRWEGPYLVTQLFKMFRLMPPLGCPSWIRFCIEFNSFGILLSHFILLTFQYFNGTF